MHTLIPENVEVHIFQNTKMQYLKAFRRLVNDLNLVSLEDFTLG